MSKEEALYRFMVALINLRSQGIIDEIESSQLVEDILEKAGYTTDEFAEHFGPSKPTSPRPTVNSK